MDDGSITKTLITQDNTTPNILNVEAPTWIHTEDCSVRIGQAFPLLESYGHMIRIIISKTLHF